MNRDRIVVLLVENETDLARTTRRQLERLGCAVLIQSTIRDALAALEREEIDVVVADNDLGEPETGADLLALLARTQPQIGRVLYSATPGVDCEAADVLLTKPALLDDLRRALVTVSSVGSPRTRSTER